MKADGGPTRLTKQKLPGANERQIGGEHYKREGQLQHWDWAIQLGLGYLEGSATKYVSRWRNKNGRQDLEKALHFIEKLVEAAREGLVTGLATTGNYNDLLVKFHAAYELTPTEVKVVALLSSWETTADLQQAKELVEAMLSTLPEPAATPRHGAKPAPF